MRVLFTIFMLITFGSCQTIPKEFKKVSGEIPHFRNENCEKVLENISKNWAEYKYSQNKEACFYYNRKLIMEIIENKKCLIGINKKELISLFGNPSHTTSDNYFYFVSTTCESTNSIMPYFRFTIQERVDQLFFDPVIPIN